MRETVVTARQRRPLTTLRDVRVRRGIALRELERLSGIPRGNISRIERGIALPTWHEVNDLAAALDVDPAEFRFATLLIYEGDDA